MNSPRKKTKKQISTPWGSNSRNSNFVRCFGWFRAFSHFIRSGTTGSFCPACVANHNCKVIYNYRMRRSVNKYSNPPLPMAEKHHILKPKPSIWKTVSLASPRISHPNKVQSVQSDVRRRFLVEGLSDGLYQAGLQCPCSNPSSTN